jgi:hypothetical protein
MTDSEHVREVIDAALRHLGPQRVITAAALASQVSRHLGRAVTEAEVTAILAAYEQEGTIQLARPSGSTPTVTSVSPTFLAQGHAH